MDSSHYNPTYGQWNASYTSHPLTPVPLLPPPPPLPPPPSHILQSHSASPNFCSRSNQSDFHRPNYYVFSNRHDFQPKLAVSSQPSSYYSQHPSTLQQLHLPYVPEKVSYDSPMASQPSFFSCTESEDITQSVWVGYKEKGPDSWTIDAGRRRLDTDCRDIAQPVWVGYNEKRPESWTVDAGPDRMDAARGRVDAGPSRIDDVRGQVDVGPSRNYQFDYDRPSRVCSGFSSNCGLDNTSRFRDEFKSLGCVRKESGAARIEGNYEDRGQLRLESDRYMRVLGEGIGGFSSSAGYGNERYGATENLDMTRSSTTHDGAGNQRWVEAPNRGRAPFSRKRHDCHHSEVDRYFDNVRREHSSELDRMPKKQMQKKSVLLRLEAPRVKPNGRENRSRHPSHYSGKRVSSDVAVTPRSSKARRGMVIDKKERDSVTEGNGKFVTHASYEASVSEGSRQFTRKSTVSKMEKKSDSHLSPSSSPNEVKLVDGFGQDCKLKITDAGPEALTCVSEAKVCSTVYAADKISRFCEASKEPNDDSNMKLCSTREDTTDGCKSKLKSYEDVLDKKVMEIDEILNMKIKVNTSLVTSPVSWPKSADIKTLSVCSEGGIPIAATSMCSGGSQPCEEKDMDGISSRNLQTMEINAGLQETNSISSSIRTLSYGEKDLVDKSSLDASIFSISEDTGDHVLAKSSMSDVGDDIEDANKGNNKYVDSLSYAIDPSSGLPKGLVSSASLDGVSFSKDLANATNSVSGDLANANSYTGEACTTTIVNSPDRSFVFQAESKKISHSQVNGNTVNPSVEIVSMKEFMETAPLNYSAETDDILDIEEDAYVNSISSSPTKFTVKGSSNALDEDLGLASHHPAEIPFVDQFSDSDNRGLKGCFPESNASNGTNDSTFCDKFPRSSAFEIETNLAIGNSETSCRERVIDTESGFLETQPSSAECKFVPQDRFGCGSSSEVGTVWNSSMGNNPEKHHLSVSSCLVPDSSAGPSHFSPMVPVIEQIQNTTSIKAYCCDSQGDIMPKENYSVENIEVGNKEEKMNPSDVTSKFSPGPDIVAVSGDSELPCNSLPSSPRLSFGQIQSETLGAVVVDEPNKDKESDNEGALLDPLQEQIMTPHEVTLQGQTSTNTDVDSCGHHMSKDSGGDLVEKCNGDPIEKVTDVTSDVGSHVKYSPNSVKTDMCDGEVLSSDGNMSRTEVPGDSGVHISRLHSHADVKNSLAHVKDHVVSVQPRESQSKTSLNFRCEMQKGKKKSNYATQKCYPRSLPSVSDTKKDANPPTNLTKRLTWHRKSDTSASHLVAVKPLSSTLSTQQKFPTVTTQSSSSYVRKGNSLLRKPSHGTPSISSGMPPSSIKLNRITVEDKSMASVGRIGVDNTTFAVKTGERLTHEKQSRSASGSTSKISNVVATSSGKCALSSSNDHLTTGLPESIMDSATSGEAIVPHSGGDAIKTSDTLHHTGYASDCQQKKNPPKLDSSTFRKMVYVKKKANQLVAASDIHSAGKSQIPPTDGYFKRRVNQLVRNSESHVDQAISLRDDASDSQAAAKMVSERSSISAFCNSAVMRPFKQSKFSRVWKQSDPQSGIPIVHMRYQKILPQLVPWKRVTYWRRLMNSVSNMRSGSFSNISRKLLMMRKRHTVYTRSSNGYSLRKSKVLSIGGSHLKWSKSIERDSRKANEEATLAVAAFAKKTSEKHCGQSNTGTNRNHLARERIFRIGSLRYKMDSSRRTLQRISDVGSPSSGTSENGKGTKKPFIPKRLVIGNEEYVRVGNGNQLVRDPKKRTRVLANEKVRWSLHNVRLRLAKKKKYCQFFTRFGKCNKDDGKCPYIHDPSKIAVCTKFLNGLCVNANCKLTHKVIPERMPDCSYFLQGLCNNDACPYRHVHVNPNAAICDEFLKGYCSDGDECRKKHTYTCPVFEATGSCPKGSKCKLHHPKKQSKGKKRKRASEPSQKNARGRYFGSLHKDLSESEPMVLDRRATGSEVFGIQGLEFIKLDSTEYEASRETDDQIATEQNVSSDGEVLIDDLIRPVLLMQQEVL